MQDEPGYDFGAYWAQSGMMDLARSGNESDMPRFPGGVGDNSTAVQLVGGIFTALYARERNGGQGQLVDASLMRAGVFGVAHPIISLLGGNASATGLGPTPSVRETTQLGERRTRLTTT